MAMYEIRDRTTGELLGKHPDSPGDAVESVADMSRLRNVAINGVPIPYIPHIDAAILRAIEERGPQSFDMDDWHSDCGTTHCRAGWAVAIAGVPGFALEMLPNTYGRSDVPWTGMAGTLIYLVSRPDQEAPNFHCTNYDALADMRRCAALDPLPDDPDDVDTLHRDLTERIGKPTEGKS